MQPVRTSEAVDRTNNTQHSFCDTVTLIHSPIRLIQYLKPGGIDVLLSLFILLVAITQFPGFADDPGTGWHIQTGREVLQHGIPKLDPFLSGPPRTWIADQWLADVLFRVLFEYGGWPFLYGVLGAIFFATFFCILYLSLGFQGISPPCAALASFFSLKIGLIHFLARPTMFGFLFFTLVIGYLRGVRQARSLLLWEPFVAALVFSLWANMHPSFILGLLLVSIFLGVLFLEDGVFSKSIALRSCIIVFSCFIGTLINPYHFRLYQSVLDLGASRYFMRLHEEWMSPDFAELPGQLAFFMVGVIVCAHRSRLLAQIRWRELSLILVFSALALHSVRILPYLGIVLAAPFASSLTAFFQRFSSLQRVSMFSHMPLLRGGVVGVLCLLFVLVGGTSFIYAGPYGPTAEKYPYDELEFLKQQVNSADIAILAPPRWGGFITLYGDTSVRPVVDDRNQLLGESLLRRTYAALRSGDGLQELLKKYKAAYLLISRDSLLERHLRNKTAPLYLGSVAAVYGRETLASD
jgi:hypothetical protein